jgi:oxygen-independent coproporphyrinogen-3 oxidase
MKFVYRDQLWAGADLLSLGVASFGHIGGTHYQNHHEFEPYVKAVQGGTTPVYRALTPTAEERTVREFILQLKKGRLDCSYFRDKFGVNLRERFCEPLASLAERGLASVSDNQITLSRAGLLQVDRLLPDFFLPQHRGGRMV